MKKIFLGVSLCAMIQSCGSPQTSNIHSDEIEERAEGIDTVFYLPDSYQPNSKLPLVINLHGWMVSPSAHNRFFNLEKLVDRKKFVLALPSATFLQAWIFSNPAVNVKKVIDHAARKYGIDRSRVYIAGHSAGARAAYAYAAARDDVAGIIALAGDGRPPKVATPIIHVHGNRDLLVGYNGGRRSFMDYVEKNGCPSRAKEETQRFGRLQVDKFTHDNCTSGKRAIWYRFSSGHQLPLNDLFNEAIFDELVR